MSFASQFWCIITCGIGPCLKNRIKDSFSYSQWRLKTQILIGVILPLIAIQLVFAVCLLKFIALLVANSNESLYQTYEKELLFNYESQASECVNQLTSVAECVKHNINQN